MSLQIAYTPFFPGENATEYFSMDVSGGVSQRFSCNGTATSLEVALKPDIVRFVDIPCHATATKSVTLQNDSDIPTTFQILNGGDAVFHCVEPSCGVLEARSSRTVAIKFTPNLPWRYYREINILVMNQPPLTLRVLANAHDVSSKHADLAPKPRSVLPLHLDNARHFASVNLAWQQPSTLRKMLEEEGTLEVVDGRLMPCAVAEDNLSDYQYVNTITPGAVSDVETAEPPASASTVRGGEDEKIPSPDAEEVGDVSQTNPSPVVLSPSTIDFGSCPAGSHKRVASIGSRKIDVRNTSKSAVEVVWMVPDGPLVLEPTHAKLGVGEATTFSLSFRPSRSDSFFDATLECYVDTVEALRDADINDAFIIRPFRLPVHVTAETYNGAPMPPTNLKWGNGRVVCNPVAAGETAYASVEVHNLGESSARLACTGTKHADDAVVQCMPRTCIVRPGAVQVLSIAASRRSAGVAEYSLSFDVNKDESANVTVVHSVYEPSITFGSKGTVSFLPTGRNGKSQSTLTMRSTSQVPVSYQWRVPESLEGTVLVFPRDGFILPNQTLTSLWTYSPSGPGSICASVPIVFGAGGDSCGQTASVVVSGCCLSGALVASPQRIDFGNVICGEAVTSNVTLYNPSGVNVSYELAVDAPGVFLDDGDSEGTLRPLERRDLPITVVSNRRGEVQGGLTHRVIGTSDPITTRLITLKYNTISPELMVTNAFCATMSKSELWRRFSVTRLNEVITGSSELVDSDSELVFNFGAGVVGSEDCCVCLELHNPGSCETEWTLQFPDNLRYVPDEKWAECDEKDPTAEHEKNILKSKIFDASPRSGTLQPNEKMTVVVKYKHTRVAVDSLSVVLNVAGGSGLPLRFLGNTLNRGVGFVDLEWHHVELAPLPIGVQLPPVQYVTAVNRGDSPIRVSVNKSGFEALADENYGFAIMQCGGGDSVMVDPGANLVLPVRFQPMEAKSYSAQIEIQAGDATNVESVTVFGRGYDPRDGSVPTYVPTAVPADPFRGSTAGRVATLLCEALDFGVVALNSISHRMLCIQNTSANGHSIVFDFNAREFSSVLKFSPSSGRMNPGEIISIRVTFCPDGVPQIYNFDAVCSVTDEQYVLEHEQNVAAYNESVIASKTTFNITDSGRTGRGRAGNYADGASETKTFDGTLTDSMLRSGRYHALPPIKRKEVDVIAEPAPQKPPQTLFCAITATAVSPDIVEEQRYVNRHVSDVSHSGLRSSSVKEDAIVAELMENMLCDLLSENDLKNALVDRYDDSKPTIYYQQLLDTDATTIPEEETHGDTALFSCLENLLENTLANIVAEGLDGTFDVTARTRRIVTSAGKN